MEVPQHIADDLKAIRDGLHLRWNPQAILVEPGRIDASGHSGKPVWAPRWELWDTTPDGMEYLVQRVQDHEGEFRMVDDRLVERLKMLHPDRYGGSVAKLVQAQIDDPETLREMGTLKDSDNLIDAVCKWCEWLETPKSSAHIKNRGQKILSGGH